MSATVSPVGAYIEVEDKVHLRRALIASTVGTTIEWYDFLLYGTVTGLVFGRSSSHGWSPVITPACRLHFTSSWFQSSA